MDMDRIRQLSRSITQLDDELRERRGLNQGAFEQLKQLLREFALDWASSDVIPKAAANILVDLYHVIESDSYLYHNDDAERIRQAADEVLGLVHECLRLSEAQLDYLLT